MYAHGFRVYFTPFTRVLFAFPSRYWFTIGRSGVFSLGGWSPHIQTGFLVPRPTHFSSLQIFRIPGYHRLWPAFPGPFCYICSDFWAAPRSLVTTGGISVDFFSSGYLDISVLRVCFQQLCIHCRIPIARWVSPFGHCGINACCQLPRTFRRLPRPSSPLTAKASTVCAWSLDHITSSLLDVTCANHNYNTYFRHHALSYACPP